MPFLSDPADGADELLQSICRQNLPAITKHRNPFGDVKRFAKTEIRLKKAPCPMEQDDEFGTVSLIALPGLVPGFWQKPIMMGMAFSAHLDSFF